MVVFALIVAPASYWDEVRSISNENTESNQYGTGAQRIYSWKLGWHMFLKNPVMGVGQGNYPWNVGETEDELGINWNTRSLSGRAAHSLYFTLLPELGLIGTGLFILMLVYSIKDLQYIKRVSKGDNSEKGESKSHKNNSPARKSVGKYYYHALALEGSLIGFLASSVFISTLYYPSFWILCAYIVALKKIMQKKYENLKPIEI